MKPCPISDCGRKFQNDETMLEHVRRRHPGQFEFIREEMTRSVIEHEHEQQKQLRKLPKLAKIMSKQKDQKQTPKITYRGIASRRSQSKGKQRKTNVSGIIQQSRQQVATQMRPSSKGLRPALNKKISAPNLLDDKLPSIDQSKLRKNKIENDPQISAKKSSKQHEKEQNFYRTAPNFLKDLNESKKKLLMRSKSKGGHDKSKEKIHQTQKIMHTSQISQVGLNKKLSIDVEQKTTSSFYRPVRKNLKKSESKEQQKIEKFHHRPQEMMEDIGGPITMKLFSLKQKSPVFDCPKLSTIEFLYLNECQLQKIELNCLSSLVQISLIRNNLTSMDFLNFQNNQSIRKIFIDHNKISQIYLPSKVKLFTASFNKISEDQFDNVLQNIEKAKNLEEIDLSFNSVRKAPNYKSRLLENSTLRKIKKIDGLKVTKMDWEIMAEYCRLMNEELGLISLRSQGYGGQGFDKERPSTAMSTNISNSQVTSDGQTVDSLQNECKQFEKLIKEVKKQYEVIRKENKILEQELQGMEYDECIEQKQGDGFELYEKLKKECEILQALSFLRYAEESELVEMIEKKKIQI